MIIKYNDYLLTYNDKNKREGTVSGIGILIRNIKVML